ncbi:MAG: Ku protein [Desulfobulbaceae bacterium]|jgi:DNA end-binding protein Ku|nr:Ku protein [Desulfobulbaceae bacterium]MDY0351746.1 Ku protein [Desulfobulbaceae bacterium]
MAEKKRHGDTPGAFWSGAITFGLVSIQVDLYSAHRPKSTVLRMVDRHGVPLRRRYFCPRDHKPLEREEIVRGYEIEDGRHILISDEELEALEPKKSREIDLRCFVDAAELDPVYFEHAYYLLPAGSVSKPYRLLARIMENSGKAGVATFVMREREHLVAILAEKGILRAETLRFADEIRSPEDIGLPSPEKAPAPRVKQMRQAMKKLQGREFDRELLHDRRSLLLLQLVDRKLKAGEDVVEKPPASEAEGAEIIDLMAIIKQRFAQHGGGNRQ